MATLEHTQQGLWLHQRRRRVFALALPAVGEQLLNTLVGLVDIFLVGNLSNEAALRLGYDSPVALAAAGLANQLIWLVTVFFIALGVGSTALVARSVGAGEHGALRQIVRQSMLIAFIIGAVLTLLSLALARPFLLTLGAAEAVVGPGERYIQLVALSFLPTALLFAGNACLRGAGDTRTPLYVMLGINGANALITWLLVNGNLGMPALGVEGAAIGTALARGVGGIVLVLLLLRGLSGLQLERSLRPEPQTIRRILRIGAPTAGEMLIFQGALLVFTRFVTGLGTVAYAAHNVAITIESLSFLPGLGYAYATSALVGQALGARDPDEAEKTAYEALLQGGLLMTLCGMMMFLMPRQLVSLFVNDPAVIEAAVAPLQAGGLVQPALATGFILLGAMRGAGDTRWPVFSRLLTNWGVRLPLTALLVLVFDMGLAGVWLAMCTDFTLQALLTLWRFNSRRWQRIEV